MRLVIADTSPIHYLVHINQIELLHRTFERVAIPRTVQQELSDRRATLAVRQWIATAPSWLEIHKTPDISRIVLEGLDEGETAAIALAEALQAELLLIDERDGFRVAVKRGLRATGTLGVLDLAAERGLIDFAAAIGELEQSSFRIPAALLSILLSKHTREG